jgi:ABC-2 type transport system permease protein
MAESGWLGHALRVGLVEWRRSVRATRADAARLAIYGIGALFGLLALGLGVYLLVVVADDLSGLVVSDGARGNLALFWLFLAFIVGQRAVSLYDRVDAEALVLTTVSARTAAVGLVVAETLRALTLLAVPVAVLTGAFVYATGALAPLVAVPFAVTCFLATAVAVGVTLGWTAALLVARVPFVARHKTALGGVLVLGFFGVYMAFQLSAVGIPVDVAVLAALPPGWVADLLVAGSPVGWSATRAAAAAVGGPLAVAGLGAVATRVATAYWYTDPVDPTDDGDRGRAVGDAAAAERDAADPPARDRDALAAAIAPLSMPALGSGPARRVAQLALVRTRRQPARLSFLLAPLAVVGSTLVSYAGASGGVGLGLAPVVLALTLAWLSGAAFGLNPLGDEAPVLPATLLSTVGGRRFVRGLCLPGLLVGVPLATLVTAGGVVAAGHEPLDAAGLVGLALVLSLAAVGLAPGVGTRFPRFDSVTVGRSREVIPPALSAVIVYSLGLGLAGGVAAVSLLAPDAARALVAGLVSALPSFVLSLLAERGLPTAGLARAVADLAGPVLGVPLGTVRAVGYAGPLALVALAGYRGYRNAARRFDRFRVD